MDNLTHTLCATALAKTRLGRRSPLSPAALVVCANLPDLDGVVGLWGRAAYLVHHRGITHSLPGIALQIALCVPLFAWLERRRHPARPRGAPGPALAVLVGLASHPLLDLLNTYGIRPWLPFGEGWVYGDLVFIVDPWLWLLFGAATALAGARTRLGSLGLALVAAFGTLVVLAREESPPALRVAWCVAVPALALLRARGVGERRPRLVAGAALALLVGYLGLLFGAREAARHGAVESMAGVPHAEGPRSMSPKPADPFAWRAIARFEDRWIAVDRSVLSGTLGLEQVVELDGNGLICGDDTRLLAALAGRPEVRAWRVFARHPWAELRIAEDGVHVLLTDARYQMSPLVDAFCALRFTATDAELPR